MGQPAIQRTADKTFADFYLSEKTLRAIEELGYTTPTPVQAQSIPLVIAGIDLTVMSQTGTGKTAAFAIPTVEIVDPTPGQIDVLVLAPTRELAIQVSREFEKLGKFKGIEVATIYGGTSYEKQYQEIAKATVVVATPGRLIDLIESGKCDLRGIKHFILDEADEMLSMGFAEDLDKIIEYLPEDRQSLLFSATITNEVRALAKKLLFYPEFISMSDDSVAAKDVTHVWYPVRGVGRTRELLRVIEYEQPDQAIVFANTKADTVKITDSLVKHGIKAKVINGDLPQKAREQALKELRAKEFEILVATDVAARGIDITGLTHVFNYVVPDNAEVYIHRAGRTGRAGSKGRAISLVSPAEFPTLHAVKKHFGVVPQMAVLPTTREIITAKRKKHLAALGERLTEKFDLPYGAKLGLATQLLQSSDDPNAVKLVARLLTLSDALRSEGEASQAGLTSLKALKSAATDERGAKNEKHEKDERCEKVEKTERNERKERVEKVVEPPSRDATQEASVSQSKATDGDGTDEREEKSATPSRRAPKPRVPRRTQAQPTDLETDDGAKAEHEQASEPRPSRRRRRRGRNLDGAAPAPRQARGRSKDRAENDSSRTRPSRRSESSDSSKDSETYVSTRTNHLPFAKTEFGYKRLWVNLGSSIFSSEQALRDALVFLSGFGAEDFGPISIETSFSYVDVREDYFEDIIYALSEQQWEGHFIAVEAARK